jgi:rhodanese-related sulfurtransferase
MPLVRRSTVVHSATAPGGVCAWIAAHPGALLLDVRTAAEFAAKDGAPPTFRGAINIPVQELPARMSELDRYKDRTVLVFCSHSHRSPQASYMLTQAGFKKVVNMSGGLSILTDHSCAQ